MARERLATSKLKIEPFTGWEGSRRSDHCSITIADSEWPGGMPTDVTEENFAAAAGCQIASAYDGYGIVRHENVWRVIDEQNVHHLFDDRADADEWANDGEAES